MSAKERNARYKAKDPAKVREQGRRSYHKNKHKPENVASLKRRNQRKDLMRDHGMSPEDRDNILTSQGSACAVCKTIDPGTVKGWHIDHCHTSGKTRAILCHHCNVALGMVKDNPVRLRALADYIEYHNAHV